MKTKLTIFTALLALAVAATATFADELNDLKSRFQSRDAQITALKKSGTLGETYQGYLDSPSGSATGDAQKLMTAENTDRKRLYQLIAQKEGATPETVADRNAKRNFQRAAPGESLKYPDNQWRKK